MHASAVPLLTVIVPVRSSCDRHDVARRLSFILLDTERPSSVEVLVVDDGSSPAEASSLRTLCGRNQFAYHYVDARLSLFSIGRARNAGVQRARSEFVMFMDVDLMPYPGFFQAVLDELEIQRCRDYAERFLMFGVIYLTRSGTEEYLAAPGRLRRGRFIQYLLEDDKTRIEKFSTGTSVTVWNRGHFLATGGNDPEFAGWGFEDLEYTCRAIRRAKRFPLPEDFARDYRGFHTITEYRGWKSTYRLFGDMTFQKGIVLFHAWHPIDGAGDYGSGKQRNRELFERKLVAFKERGEEPAPLPMPERGRSLLFRTNPWVYNRWIAPWLGEVVVVDEEMLSPERCIEFVRTRNIDRVVFHNPYASGRMHAIYDTVRRNGIAFLVCERGALPGSVFFDPRGFNGESESYAAERWRRPLADDEEDAIAGYVQRLRGGEESLEDQPRRVGASALRKKLGLELPNTKLIFVPLQRPSDTVITHLCGEVGSYDAFLAMVRRLAFTLPPEWVIVAKRHPLEVQSPELPGVLFADDVHVHDLIEASDALLLINSGVGVLGLAWEKPVLYAGRAIYAHPELARAVTTHDDVLAALETFRPSRDAIRQFLHYLVFEFYSFARFTTRQVPWKDGSRMTATTAIDYLVARLPECPEIRMEWRTQPEIPNSSILFDRYRHAMSAPRVQASVPAPTGPVTAAAGAKPAPSSAPKVVPGPAMKPTPSAGVRPAPSASSNAPGRPTNGHASVSDGRASMNGSAKTRSGTPAPIAKLRKLQRDPVRFLLDSRIALLRVVGESLAARSPD